MLLTLCLLLAACTPSGAVATTPAPVATQPGGDATPAPTAAADASATPAENAAAPAWATALNAALEACAGVGLDQLCYGQGAVSLTPADGAVAPALAQPGETVDLADVTGVSLGGGEAWGLAVLGLSAGIDTPGQVTLLVVMGPGEITGLTASVSDDSFAWTFAEADDTEARTSADGQPAPVDLAELPPPGEVEPAQSLSFISEAAEDDAPSGLLLMSPWEGDMATVQINGATIALGSTAFIQAESGGPLTVAMFEGGALVTAGETSVAVPPGAQASLAQADGAVAAGGEPEINILDPRAEAVAHAVAQYVIATDPRAEAVAAAVDQYEVAVDPRAEAVAAAVDQYGLYVARYYAQKYRRAINKCTDPANPQARYVYNVMYWDTLLHDAVDARDLTAALGANGLSVLTAGAQRCLRFEIDFDSTAEFTSDEVQYGVEVKAEGLPVHIFGAHLQGENIAIYHKGDIREGDAFLDNDPYGGRM